MKKANLDRWIVSFDRKSSSTRCCARIVSVLLSKTRFSRDFRRGNFLFKFMKSRKYFSNNPVSWWKDIVGCKNNDEDVNRFSGLINESLIINRRSSDGDLFYALLRINWFLCDMIETKLLKQIIFWGTSVCCSEMNENSKP